MSLVDYASSDDDVSEEIRENKENEPAQVPQDDPQPPTRPHTQSVVSSYQQPESTAHSSAPSIEKLPDASMLLNSPVFSSNMFSGVDHSSRVAAAIAESASRKRESNEFVSSVPRSKVPKGNLPHSKNVPDTIGGMLVPPQLSGSSSQFLVQLDTAKRKLRGLSFSRQEDVLLVQGWLATSMNVVHIKGQPKATYWGRVTQYFHNYKTFASDREEKSLLQRWSTIQLATKKFCEYVTQVENEHKYGMNEQDKFFYSKQLYEKLEKRKFHFDHCWKLLKDAPKWVDDMHKKKPSNRVKGTSLSPEFSYPSTSQSLVELVEDQVRNTESGNMERPQKRKEITNTDVGNIERPPIRKDVLNTDFGNTLRAPIGKDVPSSDFGSRERPLIRKDVPIIDFENTERPLIRNITITDFGNIDRPPVRKDVPNSDFGSRERTSTRKGVLSIDFGNTERPVIKKDIPNTDFGNIERPPVRKDVSDSDVENMETSPLRREVINSDFGNMERPLIMKAEKLKTKDHHKNDNANKQVVDLFHIMEKWRDQVNEEKRQYRLEKMEMLRERLKMDKERLEVDKERLRLDREDKEERIMLMDISGMPHELQQYYRRRRMEILVKGMGGV
ncbi:hypothetical protein L3X38_000395 [Prunus dulcis]|uniref:No apical meristem-associated C-terminal domain-containing protein n=1 Tax=Prunus dulcis TaxID=3755 RepID=A0AAD4YJP3_PRUDU|nr:hypothetical protein L3X38_026307 [Prunus dulcis]KAI5311191.1 hypothetical protein L3X38_000395 [Prunus dulcis]